MENKVEVEKVVHKNLGMNIPPQENFQGSQDLWEWCYLR
jgi:hypothetical protein